MTFVLFWDSTQRRVGNSVPTFWGNLSVPSLRFKHSKNTAWPLKMKPIRCPEMSIWNYHFTQCKIPQERRSQNLTSLSSFLWLALVIFSHALISVHVSSFTQNWNKFVENKLTVTYCPLSTQTTLLIYFESLFTSINLRKTTSKYMIHKYVR